MPRLNLLKPALGLGALWAIAAASGAHAATSCESLTSAKLSDGVVTSARVVSAGQFTGGAPEDKAAFPGLQAFCSVTATLHPGPDSEIKIEVWLPLDGWNSKLFEAGNGAFSPDFSYGAMAAALRRGYAATSSDTGHTENSAHFALGHLEKLKDFGYRAVHVNAVAAKEIAAAFYSAAPTKAYFKGCSTGGRQAYGAAQKYPDDFDGIIAGDPGINFTHQTAEELSTIKYIHENPDAFIAQDRLAVLHAAVVSACDTLDGVKDGVIENPLACHYDPKALQCRPGADKAQCLTAPQVALVEHLYAGAFTKDGKLVFPGFPRGSEMGWGRIQIRLDPMEYGLDAYRLIVKQDPNWDYRTIDLDQDVPYGDKTVGAIMNNYDPDLKPYFAHGGKLIGYHGWADPMTTAMNSLAYYKAVEAAVGTTATRDSYRMFFVPGMFHCEGGDSISTFDMLDVIDQWVVTGKAPDDVPASQIIDDKTVRTRPLCAYPEQAVYAGKGSTDDIANFRCKVVAQTAER